MLHYFPLSSYKLFFSQKSNMSTFNLFDRFIDSGRNLELFNLHFSVPSRNHSNATTNTYFSHFDRVPSQEPTSSQQQSHDRSISSRVASSPVQPRSSVASHLPPEDRPNIIEPDEDESVERRLLDHLAEMSLALSHTYHRAWTREATTSESNHEPRVANSRLWTYQG
jgi:hypothetical protein